MSCNILIPSPNYKDLTLFDNIKNDVLKEYKNLSKIHIKSIIDERYKSYGGKFKDDLQITNMSNYCNSILGNKFINEKENITTTDLVKKFGRKKVIALKLCKEVDEEGIIDWRNGTFITSKKLNK
tara:strand:+ start:330 stop:704 length:375 start_codon:yes stop_codon:yes gene_type:complete